ncbi:lipid II flippase MurJ, partial [Streptomyces lonarensis]|uniref:lipid II flippase MurJ n=1 Tax=Streptomyces lonarensis TaxID=700599 RepID=UPI001FD8298F
RRDRRRRPRRGGRRVGGIVSTPSAPGSPPPEAAPDHAAAPASPVPAADGAASPVPVSAADRAAAPHEQDQGPVPGDRFVARAALVTALLTAGGSLLGLVRDQTLAHLFGAGSETDAFLVAWTFPEFASTVLIEDAMALVLVPAFSLALARRGLGTSPRDPVGELLRATLPRLLLVLAVTSAVLAAAAPLLVRLLAPGLADPQLAADCTRMTAVTVLTFGTAGYLSAVLRAHHSFAPPAAIYIAYNLGIVAAAFALHTAWGMRAAALGVALGSLLMVLVQLPAFLRRLPARRLAVRQRSAPAPAPAAGRRDPASAEGAAVSAAGPLSPGAAALALVAPVALFALSRQAQVLVERFLASDLPAGAISHLNYAQKVAQLPMVLSLMIVTVTLPVVARAMAEGDLDGARRRVERDLVWASGVVLAGAAYVLACGPQLIEVLFQRGAFDAAATEATAAVMRVYALGLLGHTLVGTLARPFFSAARPTWYPMAAMACGLTVTAAAGAALVGPWGAPGLAAANAAGIAVAALLMLRGLRTRVLAVDIRRVLAVLARLACAATAAAVAGWALAYRLDSPTAALVVTAVLVPSVLVAASAALRVPEVLSLVTEARRRLRHVRSVP